MRVKVMQVPYPQKGEALKVLDWQMKALNDCKEKECDLILFPENANCTGYENLAHMKELILGPGAAYVRLLGETAKRTGALVMSGLMNYDSEGVLRNQLTVFTPEGESFSPYTKVHLVEPELAKGIRQGEGTGVFEYKGVRYGGTICFDFYFPELFAAYAKERIDVMITASHQRQERPEILEFLSRARAFDCGCTMVRCAPAMPGGKAGGRSMVVSPEGNILGDAGMVPGILECEFDPHARFMRPASYGEPDRVIDYREALNLSRSHVDK